MLAVVDSGSRPRILRDVPAWFEEWEQSLSRFRSDSELCQLNIRDGQSIPVSRTLWDVYQASVEACLITDGLVSPLVLDALLHAGYDQSFERMSAGAPRFSLDDEAAPVSLADITTDVAACSICLPKGARLDFGGVAKGWAAHQAMERLKAAGPALVDAGGDIAVSGPRSNGEPWPIGVADPFHPDQHLEIIYLERGGVATSGKDYRHWTRGGIQQHHIIDPRTGLPAETDVLAATVIAPTVMEAEAIAKAVMISGSRAGLMRLEGDASLAGLLVLENGERLDSCNFRRFLS